MQVFVILLLFAAAVLAEVSTVTNLRRSSVTDVLKTGDNLDTKTTELSPSQTTVKRNILQARDGGLSGGVIAGIVIGGILGIIVLCASFVLLSG